MPVYHTLGHIPRKRHIVYRQPDGRLYTEELMGNLGFTGPSSLVYHVHQPTQVLSVEPMKELAWVADWEATFRNRHFRTSRLPATRSVTADRVPLLFNADVALSFVQPIEDDEYFYRNAQGDELIFVSDGEGVLESPLGSLPFGGATTSSSRAASSTDTASPGARRACWSSRARGSCARPADTATSSGN